jgi:hypothetical protein
MVQVRLVSLSQSADELARSMADDERVDPDVFCSLLLEMAIRERHADVQRLAEALAKVRGA